MKSTNCSAPRRIAAAIAGSLEVRLIGALTLIAACSVILHFISQDRAFKLRAESEALRAAASNAEHAEQLVEAVSQFRLATSLFLARDNRSLESAQASDQLTDAAIKIGNHVNAVRLGGMELPATEAGMAVFGELDRQVGEIVAEGSDAQRSSADPARIDERNVALAAAAGAVRKTAVARRDEAQARLSRSVANWQLLVTVTGGLTILLVLAILVDLVHNILPALRRMHDALRRLASGDLDVEIGSFRLRELQALSGPLETFRRNAQAVKNLAFTDPSTGMPNRRAFMERASDRLGAGPREGERGFAVILADIDRFKHVNDDYGHAAGDRLVKLVGERMAGTLGEGAIIARAGGDEFALCIPLERDRPTAAMTSALLAAIRQPFDLGDFCVAITMSLGVVETRGGADATDVNEHLNKADLALYAAKNAGRNRAVGFTSELEAERQLNRALERDLALAFEQGQLRMVYQPIKPVGEGEHEVEALVRWQHPILGEISPARFIPAAERSGLMVSLGNWIVEQSLTDLTRWPDLAMSINLSPLQLQQDGFVGFIMDCCARNGIDPRRLTLEVTESLSIERNTRALLTLELLRNAGFRIALDDFGTGYSSLCMMKSFRFDRLKLDRSLISDIGKDRTSQAVFDAAVTMALTIGAEVVAEGISEEALVEPVRSAGCTHLQGFHFSRPIEADAVEGFYREALPEERKVA